MTYKRLIATKADIATIGASISDKVRGEISVRMGKSGNRLNVVIEGPRTQIKLIDGLVATFNDDTLLDA